MTPVRPPATAGDDADSPCGETPVARAKRPSARPHAALTAEGDRPRESSEAHATSGAHPRPNATRGDAATRDRGESTAAGRNLRPAGRMLVLMRPSCTQVTAARPLPVMATWTSVAPRPLPGTLRGEYHGPPGVRTDAITPVRVAHAAIARPSSLPATTGGPAPRAGGAMAVGGNQEVAAIAPGGAMTRRPMARKRITRQS